jgi:hypothetical protein
LPNATVMLMSDTFQPDELGLGVSDDPMEAEYWTFPMVVAWIGWRTRDAVSANCDPYRSAVLGRHPNGAPKAHFASVAHLLSQGRPQGLPIKGDLLVPLEDAYRLLLEKLCDTDSGLNVFAQEVADKDEIALLPIEIMPGPQWQHRKLMFERGDGQYLPEALYVNSRLVALEPTIARRRVMQLWPASQRKRNARHANVSARELEQWYKQTFTPFGPEYNSRENVRALGKQKFGSKAKVGRRLEKLRVSNLDSPLKSGIKTSTSKG